LTVRKQLWSFLSHMCFDLLDLEKTNIIPYFMTNGFIFVFLTLFMQLWNKLDDSHTIYSVIHGLTGIWGSIRWYELDSTVARVCKNKARTYSIKHGFSRFLKTRFAYDFIRLFNGSKYGLVRYVRSSAITCKHDLYSTYSTFTRFTYGPADSCSRYARISTHLWLFWYKFTHFDDID